MSDKGEYRGFYVALPDDPDFQELSGIARAVLYPLKLKLGKAGIDVFYPETLPRLTGFTREQTDAALDELRAADWVRCERTIYWLRNGLRFDPADPLASPNGRKGIENHLRTLPRLGVVAEFAGYYQLEDPHTPRPPAETPETGEKRTPSEGASKPLRSTEDGRRKRKTEDGNGRRKDSGSVEPGKKPARKRASALPDDWEPSDDHAAIAEDEGRDLHRERVRFRDWAAAIGATRKDWDATFRNWLRNDHYRGRGGGRSAAQKAAGSDVGSLNEHGHYVDQETIQD